MKRITLLLLFLAISIAYAGNIELVEKQKLTDNKNGQFFFPKFSPDGKSVFFTSSDFRGLWRLNLSDLKIDKITDSDGAGYKFGFSRNGQKLFYRTTRFKNKRKYHSLYEYDLQNNTEKIIESDERNLSSPLGISTGNYFYLKNGTPEKFETALEKTEPGSFPLVYIENRNLILIRNGKKKVVNPLGDGIYLWPSVSPDGEKLLFTLGGKGTYVSDLDGNILLEIGYANYPKWSPDGKWILFMRDKDNGYTYTESDLFVISSDGKDEVQLTDTPAEIEMYGEWSPGGKEIIYHNEKGEIYILKLKIN